MKQTFCLSPEAKNFLEKNRLKKIVFTNGCFDILHPGHIAYLNEAKAQGDLLVVGINSDASVRKLKGPDRPINNEIDRKFMMENIKAVDLVEIFDEETPLELITAIRPSVLVKGGDWKIEQIVGHDVVTSYGGEVKSLLFKDGHSTSNLIKNLQGKL